MHKPYFYHHFSELSWKKISEVSVLDDAKRNNKYAGVEYSKNHHFSELSWKNISESFRYIFGKKDVGKFRQKTMLLSIEKWYKQNNIER